MTTSTSFLSLSIICSILIHATSFIPSTTISKHRIRPSLIINNNRQSHPIIVKPELNLGNEWYNSPESSSDDDDDDDEDEEEIDLSDSDWRAFRAKLVMQPTEEPSPSTSPDPMTDGDEDLDGIGAILGASSSQKTTILPSPLSLGSSMPWAYDSGYVIEEGAVILGGVEQDFGFGLRQQYFHKVLILVLDHDENKFTKGIILNRPTGMYLDDDKEWRVWFGGDVQGMESPIPEVVCLHSLESEEAKEISRTVMKDIKACTFEQAKELVQTTSAKPSDFWVFCGYAGWGPEQLLGELHRKSWYMVSTDSQTLLKGLAENARTADPRDAGLDTWEALIGMIGKNELIAQTRNNFDDLMLKEWARDRLCTEYGMEGEIGMMRDVLSSTQDLQLFSPFDRLIKRVKDVEMGEEIKQGSLLRASPHPRSPFLLNKQELHKSLMLVLTEDDDMTIGCIINRVSAKGLQLEIRDTSKGDRKTVTIPVRYGGEYAVKGQNPLIWLHSSNELRQNNVGSPVGPMNNNGMWKCTSDQATNAIAQGIASYHDFIIVSGVCVWTKGAKGLARGMQGEVQKGNFQPVPPTQTQKVWDILQQQRVLEDTNIIQNLGLASNAWTHAGDNSLQMEDLVDVDDIMDGIGEGYDEENESLVFKSSYKVSKLSDDALRSWVATFLLGAPTMG